MRRLLGIDGKYASVRDFFSDVNEYKLEKPLRGIDRFADPQGLREAAEKFDIINRLTTGKSLKIFPLKDAEGKIDGSRRAMTISLSKPTHRNGCL